MRFSYKENKELETRYLLGPIEVVLLHVIITNLDKESKVHKSDAFSCFMSVPQTKIVVRQEPMIHMIRHSVNSPVRRVECCTIRFCRPNYPTDILQLTGRLLNQAPSFLTWFGYFVYYLHSNAVVWTSSIGSINVPDSMLKLVYASRFKHSSGTSFSPVHGGLLHYLAQNVSSY